jgi:hypothetical protein
VEFGFDFGGASFDFDFNNSTDLDNYNFENMDVDDALGMDNLDSDVSGCATFDYEQAFVEAAISIGIQDGTDSVPSCYNLVLCRLGSA